jgi:secreted PhoX family phosphatase
MKTNQSVPSFANCAAWRSFLGLTVACAAVVSAQAGEITAVKPYAVAVSPDYALKPLLSVGEKVPNTSDPTKEFQMIGIPDGLGATKGDGNTTILYMNHELTWNTLTEPNVGGPLNRGALVSRWVLDKEGCVVSGQRAYDTVYDAENNLVLPAAQDNNTTRAFGRFCSGSLSFREAGFDRPIYLTGEESDTDPRFGGTDAVFDGKGGLAVAIFDNQCHTLVKMGRFPWENTLARPDAGEWTVVMGMEDGPASLDNQLYMYVGKKDRRPGASALSRNGLDTGKLYTFVSDTPGQVSELTFTSGSITGHWVELPDQTHVDEATLETQTDAVGAFAFVRIEDGAWSKTDKNKFYFVTTGSGPVAAGNVLGRTYQLDFDKKNILGTTKLTVVYNGDTVAAAGGDIGFAPDNIDVSKDYLMIHAEPPRVRQART